MFSRKKRRKQMKLEQKRADERSLCTKAALISTSAIVVIDQKDNHDIRLQTLSIEETPDGSPSTTSPTPTPPPLGSQEQLISKGVANEATISPSILPNGRCLFFRIPAEIRNKIYQMLLELPRPTTFGAEEPLRLALAPVPPGIFRCSQLHPGILATCKQINHEASTIFFGGNQFRLYGARHLLSGVRLDHASAIRDLELVVTDEPASMLLQYIENFLAALQEGCPNLESLKIDVSLVEFGFKSPSLFRCWSAAFMPRCRSLLEDAPQRFPKMEKLELQTSILIFDCLVESFI
ncbi:MAG: hypothetical protein M1829_006559 [Trizodia sp. TS-e1964]|nr:MAG: hypothetical protein M1829_006559 [Trizodia sp. TS-e1964]